MFHVKKPDHNQITLRKDLKQNLFELKKKVVYINTNLMAG